MMVPACFDLDEWLSYHAHGGSRRTMCHDCLPRYQRDMMGVWRCEHPSVVFRCVDGDIVGSCPGVQGEDDEESDGDPQP